MKLYKKILTALLCATLAVPAGIPMAAHAQGLSRNVVIDGDKADTAKNMLWRGAGMVSANNSSRLLLDYKAENPAAYQRLLNYIFGEDGIGITHLKLEMGADVNSSSGTEPTVKRTEDEPADVTRGAGYQLAADAKAINPDLTLDMLYWSEPLWVTNAEDVYAARYKWYKETLDAAYETYGLEFDYVSAVRNERATDTEWIKYLSKALKSETDCPYDYSKIKIVVGEEVCSWNSSREILKDEELINAVDVIGSHYTSWSDKNAQKLRDEYGKELWLSEDCSPMEYAEGTWRFDGNGSGMSQINGLLDIANRIITMVPGGGMTLYEYQPVVAAYYDGVCYCHKQLITANEPWSGDFKLDNGFFMSLHFSQFMKRGWAFVEDACYADGKAGGDGHALVDATYSYITACDTETGDYSFVVTNTTAEPITYNITAKNLAKAGESVYVWETRGNDGGEYDENYFKHIDTITPAANGDEFSYSVTVKPYSLVTLSTVQKEEQSYYESSSEVLPLPYSDDYEYADYPADYLSSRGNAPRYTTDEGGAFEVQNVDGNNVLMQMITPDIKAEEWGGTPSPETSFGDDRWFNYSVSADVKLAPSDNPAENYAGVGLRYNLGESGKSGWWLSVYEDGSWKLKRNKKIKEEGIIEGFDAAAWNTLRVEAVENTVRAYLNGELLCELVSDEAMLSAGRAALYSSYNNNCFDNFTAEPIEGAETYISRFDNTDLCFTYSGEWSHDLMSSFKNYKRTISTGSEGAAVTVSFEGTGFAIGGLNKNECVITVKVDGEIVDENITVGGMGARESGYHKHGLPAGQHTAEITVVSGQFCTDMLEVIGGEIRLLTEKEESVPTEEPAETAETAGTAESSGTADSTDSEKKSGFPVVPVAVGAGVAVAAAVAGVIIAKVKKK